MKYYINKINKYFPFIKLLLYSVILSTLLLILDFLNIPSQYIYLPVNHVIFGAVVLSIVLIMINLHIIDAIKLTFVNFIDAVLFVFLSTIFIFFIVSESYKLLYGYKIIILTIAFGSTLITIVYRCIKVKNNFKKEYKSNVYDLKDIYENNFNIDREKEQAILVNTKDVDYDLLRRDVIIHNLVNAIKECNPNGRFVISLEGPWGSGKTTIINNVKKILNETEKNIVIIDEFDPWSYGNQENLLFDMFDSILKKTNLKYSTLSTKLALENLSDSILGNERSKGLLNLLSLSNRGIITIKDKINDLLKTCGKKIVFFIDNIDRAENENILLLFKLVGNVFDFERITYVLSFDDERIKDIFTINLSENYNYLKKIIQMQIRVPEISRNDIVKLFSTCIQNILRAYGDNDFEEYESILSQIFLLINDLRDFKRFINSVVYTVYRRRHYLYNVDKLVIEFLRMNNTNLYQKIYENRKYFISHDKIYDPNIYTFNKKEFNIQAKEFFIKLFSDSNYKPYLDLLQEIFPYIKRYKNSQDLESETLFISSDDEYTEIAKHRRICSAKYFDLYFTEVTNLFLGIGLIVEDFIQKLLSVDRYDDKEKYFVDFLNELDYTIHKELFERLQLYVDDLSEKTTYDLVQLLFFSITQIDDTPYFGSLSARKRVEVIIYELLKRITEDQYDAFLIGINKEYDKMENISSILYWFAHDKKGRNIDGREQKMVDMHKKMGDTILSTPINIYDDVYYEHNNIWGLYRLYRDQKSKIIEYIRKCADEKTTFRILYDISNLSLGSKYRYFISKEYIDKFTTEEDIDRILEKAHPNTEDQQFILDVYNNYKQGIKDDWGETGIVTDNIKYLNL